MLRTCDFNIVNAAYLSSNRLLFSSFIGPPNYYDEKEIIQNQLLKAVIDYQPYVQRKLRTDDISAMLNSFGLLEERFNEKKLLTELAKEFLRWHGNCFVVKPEKLSQWLELQTLCDGSWVIGQAYANLINDDDFDALEIAHCIELYQCPFALPKNAKQIADNHVHLGGHGSLSPSLLSFCLYGAKTKKSFSWPTRPEYTVCESGLLEKNDLAIQCALIADELVGQIFESSEKPITLKCNFNSTLKEFEYKAITGIEFSVNEFSSQQLISKVTCEGTPLSKAWLLYLTGLLVDKRIAVGELLPLIRYCNILRNYMVVAGVGLTQFVQYFRFKGRETNSISLQDDDQRLISDIDKATFREFRFGPALLFNKNETNLTPGHFAKKLKQLYLSSLSNNVHFVIHFTRSGKREDKLQEALRIKIKNQVNLLQDFTHSITFSQQEITTFSALFKKTGVMVDLRKAIRGYDVAGNENYLPIEVFAPALRKLRDSKYPVRGIIFNRQVKPHITVHAGEDFSHLLSGMRAIDEAVLFCDFQENDRVGHGLALGIEPKQWAKRQQTAYLTVGDHLDNLVWCYHKALTVIQSVPSLVGVLPLLQEKIQYWSEFLFGESQTPKRLYDAWLLRRNCPLHLKVYESTKFNLTDIVEDDAIYSGWVIDSNDFSKNNITSKKVKLWEKYLQGNLDGDYFSKREKIVSIDCFCDAKVDTFGYADGRLFDSISLPELDLYEAIQDWSMEYYAAKGVIIEACPTSNIYIGRFEHYHEHPIFRWDPPEQEWLKQGEKYNRFGLRKGSVTVCINTDDAALMPTTIQNEHRVLQKAAVEHFNVGVNKAEDWIERVRRKGVEIFKANHLDWVNK